MAVTITDTINVRSEKAVAAYIRNERDPNSDIETFTGDIDYKCTRTGALNLIPVYEGRITQQRESPSIVVMTVGSEKPWEEVAWYLANVEIQLFTHRHEDENDTELSEVVHNQRAKAIFDLIMSEDDMKTALNKPKLPLTDTRPVDEFTLTGSMLADNSGSVTEEMFNETWILELFCSPYDAAT